MVSEILKILIGSEAMRENGLRLKRDKKDIDYLCRSKDFSLVASSANGAVDLINGDGIMDKYNFTENVANISELYTLKVSHSPWVIKGDLYNWYKHLNDIRLLRDNGGEIIPPLYSAAYSEWEKRLGRKNVNLNKDTEEFFENNVKRKYIHDSVHQSIAFYNAPLFNKILSGTVKVSEEKFNNLSYGDKVKLAQEEVMVLSLERDLIPEDDNGVVIDKGVIYDSYAKQLCLLITKYSKNWFPQFIIENYFEVATPPFNYWDCFMDSGEKILL